MINKTKSSLLLLCLSAIACVSLTGCGGNTYQDKTLPEGDPESVVEIKFWNCLGHAKGSNLQLVADRFNEKYAGKYHVSDIEKTKIAGDYDELAGAIKTKMSSGEIPAMAMGYPDSFSSYMTNDIDESALYRVDPFIKDAKFGYTEAELADFVPGFYAEGTQYQFEGTWSMPLYKSTEIMYYNAAYMAGLNDQTKAKLANDADFNQKKTAFEALAASATDEQIAAFRTYVQGKGGYVYDVPQTWNQLVALGRQFLADRATENVKGEFYGFGYDSDANLFISQFAQRGIPYTVNNDEANNDSKKHYVFNNDKAKAFLTEMVGLINETVMITKGRLGGKKYTNELFGADSLAITIGSTGGSSYNISANFPVRLAPVPYADGYTPKYIQQGPSICFFDNNNDYIHKGAWLFYKEIAESVSNAKLALENSYDPIRISSYETDDYKNFIEQHDVAMKYDIPYHTKDLKQYYMTSPVFPGSDDARTQIGKLIAYAVSDELGVDGALRKAYNLCTGGK